LETYVVFPADFSIHPRQNVVISPKAKFTFLATALDRAIFQARVGPFAVSRPQNPSLHPAWPHLQMKARHAAHGDLDGLIPAGML